MKNISFPNTKVKFKIQDIATSATALFNFKITYLSEDEFEEIKSFAVNLKPLELNEKFFTSNYSLYINGWYDPLVFKNYIKDIQRVYEIACNDLIKKQELTEERIKLNLQKN